MICINKFRTPTIKTKQFHENKSAFLQVEGWGYEGGGEVEELVVGLKCRPKTRKTFYFKRAIWH